MKPNEAIDTLTNMMLAAKVVSEIEQNALLMAIQALESVSKTDNGEVKSAEIDWEGELEQAVKRKGIFYAEGYIEGLKDGINQFPSVKVVSGSVMSPNEIVNACKEELLKQTFNMIHENGYPSKAVPLATILELPALMSSRM